MTHEGRACTSVTLEELIFTGVQLFWEATLFYENFYLKGRASALPRSRVAPRAVAPNASALVTVYSWRRALDWTALMVPSTRVDSP